jgi:hypothetical protein
MHNFSLRMLLVAATFALGGCGFTYHFKSASTLRGEEHNEWASFFLFGIAGHYDVDVRDFCPNGVHEITTGNNFVTWLISFVTIGIYTPRKVNIWCAGGEGKTSFEVDFDTEGKPSYVLKRVGSSAWSGSVVPAGERRYGVKLEERTGGDAIAEGGDR